MLTSLLQPPVNVYISELSCTKSETPNNGSQYSHFIQLHAYYFIRDFPFENCSWNQATNIDELAVDCRCTERLILCCADRTKVGGVLLMRARVLSSITSRHRKGSKSNRHQTAVAQTQHAWHDVAQISLPFILLWLKIRYIDVVIDSGQPSLHDGRVRGDLTGHLSLCPIDFFLMRQGGRYAT